MALLGLALWAVLAWLFGPLLMLTAGDSCGPQDTVRICGGDGPALVGFLPGAAVSYVFLLGCASCLGGRVTRVTVIPIAYLIATVATAWAVHILSGAR